MSLRILTWCETAGMDKCVFAVSSPTRIPVSQDVSVKTSRIICMVSSPIAVRIGCTSLKSVMYYFVERINLVNARTENLCGYFLNNKIS